MYAFVNRQYILFSQSAKGIRIYGQVYPSGVMWEDSDFSRHSFFWICNPVADDNHEWLVAPRKIHTHGASNYEQRLQHRHTFVSVYDIPSDYRFPYVLGFVPGGYKALIDDSQSQGRGFLHYQTVLIALSATQPFGWDRSAGRRAPAAKPAPGDKEFRIMENPWMHQPHEGNLTISDGKTVRTYDVANWKVTEITH